MQRYITKPRIVKIARTSSLRCCNTMKTDHNQDTSLVKSCSHSLFEQAPENIFCRINTKLVSYRSFVPRMTCIDKSPPLVRLTPSTIKIGRRDWVTDINHVYRSSFTCLHQPETPSVLHSFFLLHPSIACHTKAF
jgi:hypothetical protein